MLFAILAVMCLGAIGFAVLPFVRDAQRYSLLAGAAIVFVAAASAGIYAYTGSPNVASGAGQQPDVDQMVASLAARLERQPDDLGGWKMLGRSYLTLGNFDGAVRAFERAVQLEDAQNAQTLVNLGVALAQQGGQQLSPRAVSVFENAIALQPMHPEALFWSGIAAFNRGDVALAAERWERLLSTNPPPEVAAIIEQRIAVWRGEAPPAPQPAPPPVETPGAVVRASISVSPAASEALPADATVFVIARDPQQPSPPIAVTRRRLADLPAVIELGDRDSMIPGRTLSNFAEFELLARVSVSGSPAAQPGDWFAATLVRPSDGGDVALSIDEKVQ